KLTRRGSTHHTRVAGCMHTGSGVVALVSGTGVTVIRAGADARLGAMKAASCPITLVEGAGVLIVGARPAARIKVAVGRAAAAIAEIPVVALLFRVEHAVAAGACWIWVEVVRHLRIEGCASEDRRTGTLRR